MPIFGIILIIVGFCNMKDYIALKSRCNETTTAKILCINKHGSPKNRTFSADARFTVGEDEYNVRTGTRKLRYKVGEVIDVRYDPSDPKVNYSTTYSPDKGIIMSLFGAGLLALFAVWLRAEIKSGGRKNAFSSLCAKCTNRSILPFKVKRGLENPF